jgi:hypothetical protein
LDERRVAEAANEAVAEARRGENDAKATTRAFAVKMKRAEEENRALTRRCRTLEEQVEFCLASIREDERRELKKAKGGGEAEEEEGDGDVAADENENENENEIENENENALTPGHAEREGSAARSERREERTRI